LTLLGRELPDAIAAEQVKMRKFLLNAYGALLAAFHETQNRVRAIAGIPGLDEILGGGLPELSFGIIAGAPGCGKTTMAHQIVFANATPDHPALYFTVLGEPALKMLRYQQQYAFFDQSKLNSSVRFINLSDVLMDRGLEGIIEEVGKQVEAANPGIVVVDSSVTLRAKCTGVALQLNVRFWPRWSFIAVKAETESGYCTKI